MYLSGSVLVGLVPFAVIVKRSLLVFVIQAILAYVNLLVLVPRWFLKGHYLVYACLLLALSLPLAGLRFWLEPALFSEAQFIRFVPANTYPIVLFSSTVAVLLLSTGYAMAENYFRAHSAKTLLEKKHLEAETNFLRSQINPHFLFNILNNLYSLSLLQSPKTPDAILKLAQLMRFMLYDAEQKQIPLEKEIQYINDFIELELLRFENRPDVRFEVHIRNAFRAVPPLLFIPCVENAFKFSGIGTQHTAFIHLKLEEDADGRLWFDAKNSVFAPVKTNAQPGGIGLDNLRKRLDLLFPGRFTMTIEPSAALYHIRIALPPTV